MSSRRGNDRALGDLADSLVRQKTRPVHDWHPSRVGESGMRIDPDGTWYYLNSPIRREPMVRLFAQVLRRDADDEYYLVTPAEKLRIDVVDVPFVAVDFDRLGEAGHDQRLVFRTNVDDRVVAGDDHPLRVSVDSTTGEPRVYVLIRGRLEAVVTRAAFYRLVDSAVSLGDSRRGAVGVWSDGVFFQLGEMPAD